MDKTTGFRALLTTALVFVLAACAFAQESPGGDIAMPYRPTHIAIDGRVGEWVGIAPLELRSGGLVRGAEWGGLHDLSAFIWLTWDEERLYFAADVNDDDYRGVPPGRQIWNADSVVLILHFPGQEENNDLFYLMFSTTGGSPESAVLYGRGTRFAHKPCGSLKLQAVSRDGTGPIFEGSVNWEDLLGFGHAAPQRMEFNAEVRDLDGNGAFKSIHWIPTTTTASGEMDLGTAVLIRPDDTGGMLAGREAGSGLRASVQLVELPVVVTDARNEYVRDLDEGDFSILEDGTKQRVRDLRYETRPITVGLLMDSSGSMERDIGEARDAAINFLDALREEDRAFVVAFNHNIELLKDFDGGVEEAKGAIREIRAEGGTMLYAALYFALEKLKYLREKKVLVLFSDGKDESHGADGVYTFNVDMDMIREEARRHEVTVYAIAFRLADTGALNELADLTRETGGRLFTPRDAAQMVNAYLDIARELKSQYLLSYVSSNMNLDGLWRRIEVHVNGGDYQVRTREGYYAPKR